MGLEVEKRDRTKKDTLELDGGSEEEDDENTSSVAEHLPRRHQELARKISQQIRDNPNFQPKEFVESLSPDEMICVLTRVFPNFKDGKRVLRNLTRICNHLVDTLDEALAATSFHYSPARMLQMLDISSHDYMAMLSQNHKTALATIRSETKDEPVPSF